MDSCGKAAFLSRLNRIGGKRTPVFPRDLTLGLSVTGYSFPEIFDNEYDSRKSSECVVALQRSVGHDATTGCISIYDYRAFGGEMKFPQKGIPFQTIAAFSDPSSMYEHDPSEIHNGLLNGMREACRMTKGSTPDTALVTNVAGPITMAGMLRGVESLMFDLMLEKDFADDLISFSEAVAIEMIDVLATDLSDAVFLASATDNPDMIDPECYLSKSIPAVRSLVNHIHGLGLPSIYHPHGIFSTKDRKELLNASISTGTDGFQFAEDNDPEGILTSTAGKCSILGGPNATTTLLLGPEIRVRRDTRAFLETLGNEDYIMTSSCSLHVGLPVDNLVTMVNEVRKYDSGA